jgi:cell division protein FtsI/penicillin-binding protein 2
VKSIASDSGAVIWSAPDPGTPRRAIARETAEQVAAMMAHTVNEGTSYRAFHDAHGTPFLPGLTVAGKTGTLTSPDTRRFYTWFTGFAPMTPQSGAQVAVAALVINGPEWQVKANVLAREVLRAYFASRGAAGVTRPNTTAVARRRREK